MVRLLLLQRFFADGKVFVLPTKISCMTIIRQTVKINSNNILVRLSEIVHLLQFVRSFLFVRSFSKKEGTNFFKEERSDSTWSACLGNENQPN